MEVTAPTKMHGVYHSNMDATAPTKIYGVYHSTMDVTAPTKIRIVGLRMYCIYRDKWCVL